MVVTTRLTIDRKVQNVVATRLTNADRGWQALESLSNVVTTKLTNAGES
jgi:hypothetical protein